MTETQQIVHTPPSRCGEYYKKYQHEYYLKNKLRILPMHKHWRNSNREKMETYKEKFLQQNPDKIREYSSKSKTKNKELISVRNKKLYQQKKDEMQARGRACYHRNKDRNKARYWHYGQKRRAQIKIATQNTEVLLDFVKGIKAKRFVWCYYCGKKISSNKMHWDHIIPISKGGQHSVENIAVSCPECNLQKSARFLATWHKEGQQILAL